MTIQVSTVPEIGNLGIQTKIDRTLYLSNLLNLCSALGKELAWLQEVRDRAAARVQELAIPSTRDEEWRFTDLSSLLQINFQAANPTVQVGLGEIASFILPEAINSRLVFVNGVYAPELSAIDNLPAEIFVGNVAAASHHEFLRPLITEHLAKVQGAEETFTALNTASFTDAAIAYVPKDQIIETPIHFLFVSTAGAEPVLTNPRCLVIADANSSLTLVEDYVSLGQGMSWNNPVTEIILGENAQVNHTRVQREHLQSFHLGKTAISQARDSRYIGHAVNLGAKLSRHNFDVYQTGEQTDTKLNGLTIATGTQVADTHSAIAYTKPYGTSQQMHKCIIDDRGHAIFNGKIFVPKVAQLTDAKQLSKNLLLSPKARVDTKPQLEIVADNVKCAHGATVSQLENDEVFYLQSRGIDGDSARKLLVYAFAYEIIGQIPLVSLRETLATQLKMQN